MKRAIMTIALLSALGALFFGLAPLAAYRIFHLGVLLLLLYGVGVILLLVFWDGFPDMMFPRSRSFGGGSSGGWPQLGSASLSSWADFFPGVSSRRAA